MSAPVEVTTRYVTTVDTLSDAWVFVMDSLDRVGPDPHVTIKPIRIISVGQMQDGLEGREVVRPPREFEVCVEGTVPQ
jgi:hypothetical protein